MKWKLDAELADFIKFVKENPQKAAIYGAAGVVVGVVGGLIGASLAGPAGAVMGAAIGLPTGAAGAWGITKFRECYWPESKYSVLQPVRTFNRPTLPTYGAISEPSPTASNSPASSVNSVTPRFGSGK